MITVHVHIQIKNEYVDDFISLTLENAHNSVKESGVIRFDFFRQDDDLLKFLLVEMYQDADAVCQAPKSCTTHKETLSRLAANS